jgi:hypothetical protein
MKRIIFSLTAALIVASGPIGPQNEARGQGLVEYALILVVVSIASDEFIDFLWYPDDNRGRSDSPGLVEVTFAVSVSGSDDYSGQPCRQSVRAKVGVRAGVNPLRVATNADNDTLIFNDGEVVAPLNPCFLNASNLVVELGVPVPPGVASGLSGRGPMPAPPGLNKPFIAAATVRAADGSTAAVLSYWDAGFVTLDVSDPGRL